MPSHQEARERMVERQLRARGIGDPAVLRAMGEVPREAFVPDNLQEFAYEDGPLPIGSEQTISQPFIVALMAEQADIPPGGRVLEIGTGSGYGAAVLSRLAAEVFSIERHPELAEQAQRRLLEQGYHNVCVIQGDGSGGVPHQAPFAPIVVTAGGDKVPEPLKEQLAIGGKRIVPVGGEDVQTLLCVTRESETQWREDDLGGVRFVPLIGTHGRWEGGSQAA